MVKTPFRAFVDREDRNWILVKPGDAFKVDLEILDSSGDIVRSRLEIDGAYVANLHKNANAKTPKKKISTYHGWWADNFGQCFRGFKFGAPEEGGRLDGLAMNITMDIKRVEIVGRKKPSRRMIKDVLPTPKRQKKTSVCILILKRWL